MREKGRGAVKFCAAAAWSCAKKVNGKTFYGIIQRTIREDKPCPALARYCRSLDLFVAPRAGVPDAGPQSELWFWRTDAERWAPFTKRDGDMLERAYTCRDKDTVLVTRDLGFNSKDNTIYRFNFDDMTQENCKSGTVRRIKRGYVVPNNMPKGLTTFRGAWLPRDQVEWLTLGKVYRYPGYVASSDDEEVAASFIKNFRPPRDSVQDTPVLFTFYFAPEQSCDHINVLEQFSDFPREKEWLFQHYSAFKVLANPDEIGGKDAENPVRVDIEVQAMGDEDLPCAMW